MQPHIRTFTGREINPLELRYEDVVIEDIAHALALCNRFAGHTKQPISVAQHSVYVCRLIEHHGAVYAMQGLLHDASEAYLGDITKWLKETPEFSFYRVVETFVQHTIYRRFGLPIDLLPEIEIADRVMARFEGMKGFGNGFKIDHPNYPDLTSKEIEQIGKWSPWSWKSAEEIFLGHFRSIDLT